MSSTVSIDACPALLFREVCLAEDSEILVRGKTLFQGYFSKDTGVTLPLTPEGWFATRDLGKWDDEGHLHIIGRKDNLFISGGENIQPEEVESILCGLPGITQAIVVPITDREFGERPVAFISGHTDLRALENLLPRFKLPIRYFPLPEKFQVAKPSRKELKMLASQLIAAESESIFLSP